MIRVILLGSGNLAIHLARALMADTKVELAQRYARNNDNADYFDTSIPFTVDLKQLFTADVFIIAITDDAIHCFSKDLDLADGLVIHTSGNLSYEALQVKNGRGVLYPLQTFSKSKELNFNSVPLCIEVEKASDLAILETLANSLSNIVYHINYEQRIYLHLAAVFANNFSNHLFKIAKDICDKQQLSFEILKPLIIETSNKVTGLDPYLAQTGPAKRKDQKVIENHLKHLDKNQQEIYKLLTKSIHKSYL